MKVGTKIISRQQLRYLERIQEGRYSSPEIVDILLKIVDDDDILEDREELHPGWIEIFENNIDSIKKIQPPIIWEKINSFFDKVVSLDSNIKDIDPKSTTMSFLLGAGASNPDPSNIPTVKQLLPQLLERGRRLDRDDVTRLADFCDSRKIDNIEDLLTAAQLATFSSRNPTILKLMNFLLYREDIEGPYEEPRYYRPWEAERLEMRRIRKFREPGAELSSVAFLQDTLQVLFGLLSSTMLPAKPNNAHKSIAEYAKSHVRSSIVTTNYDCCMDLALGEVHKDFFYQVDFSNVSKPQPISDKTILIKLHGSLNWFYCETCQEIQLVNIEQMVDSFQNDRCPYPVIGICRDCGGQRRGLQVPPLAMKFDLGPPLTRLMSEATISFEKAQLIVVVGFSFAEADIYISRMLSKSMQSSPNQPL